MELEGVIKKAESYSMGEWDFENPSVEMLEVNENNYLDSLSKQPVALAYFGTLYKEAQRELEDAIIKKITEEKSAKIIANI